MSKECLFLNLFQDDRCSFQNRDCSNFLFSIIIEEKLRILIFYQNFRRKSMTFPIYFL